MRTRFQIHMALASVNVQEVARISGVNPKTLYRIRGNSEYPAAAKDAERISDALDLLASQARAGLKPARRKQKAEAA